MKKNYSTTAIPVLLISIILCSCSSKNSLTISVTEPAPVYIPSEIKTIGIIDRSLPSKKNEKMDKFDKILSAEGKNLDKDGAHESVVGLFDELMQNDRFSEVKIINNANVRSPGLGIFPSALSWKTIERICDENNVDAIFVLSFYDTDAKIDYKAVPIEIDGPLGIKIPAIEHHATIATLIKTGWRIYDPINKFILDEYWVNKNVVATGVGINPVKAIKSIMGRKEAVLQVSNKIGHNYALRILPYRIRVSRHYYVRGTNNFKIAKRRAQTGNWDGAAELWDKEVSNPKGKVAGRACYNMAIINEINGDLNAAVEWASKSYTDYENKMALQYINVLKYRIERNKQLQQQRE
ncbi:MAG: hypothetical protein IIA88_11070 [Bacteroidetes bacterium]|nr:hypothetical protein [Bacteroidota bacterium]